MFFFYVGYKSLHIQYMPKLMHAWGTLWKVRLGAHFYSYPKK